MRYLFVLIILFQSVISYAVEREIPKTPEIRRHTVRFNGDYLSTHSLIIDTRTSEEKDRDFKSKKLNGNVILFIHGQQQRPKSAFGFTSKLALYSKSGIVVIPVCDTPFGKDSQFWGDRGKEVILMELTRLFLQKKGIDIDGYDKVTSNEVLIDNKETLDVSLSPILSKVTIIGWSHGAVLARRIAHAYPNAINDLVQVSPAGFVDWGFPKLIGPGCLFVNFFIECLNISASAFRGIFKGEIVHALSAGWNITVGTAGDTYRSIPSCLLGNTNILKPARTYKDIKDCSVYADDSNYPVSHLKNLVVLYGENDTVFDTAGALSVKKPTENHIQKFWQKYYPSNIKNGTQMMFKVLPGNHIGPLVYPNEYVLAALEYSEQLNSDAHSNLMSHLK